MRRKIVAGNWKMNLLYNEAIELINELNFMNFHKDVEVMVLPSFPYVSGVNSVIDDNKIIVGAQNFSQHSFGAFTGEVSIPQLRSLNINLALIGHSERRALYEESNRILKEKVDFAVQENFEFIFCCGEPLEIREAEREMEFVKAQLEESLFHLTESEFENVIIAYEPVWAIGTGLTASVEQAESMHKAIRSWIVECYSQKIADKIPILYGGSCNASNAESLFACENVDGGLIGGASLKADTFLQIINAI